MNKTITILGASQGIGRATALALAQPGHHLVLAARSVAALEALAAEVCEGGAAASVVGCDVSSETDIGHLIDSSAAISGQIDVLVNSAGTAIVQPLDGLTLDAWQTTLQINLTGTFLACKYGAAAMREGGLIVNIASIAARQGIPTWSAYCASKYGLLGFSNAIREELRPRGIRVTVVLPAATDTPLWDTIPGEWNRANMLQPADVARPIAQMITQPASVTTEELVIGHVAGML